VSNGAGKPSIYRGKVAVEEQLRGHRQRLKIRQVSSKK